MQEAAVVAAPYRRALRSGFLVVGLIIALLVTAALGFASPIRAASAPAAAPSTVTDAPARLKAVIIVGPTHGFTPSFLERGEALAKSAESYGMDVRRVFHPNATAERVLAN
ncbi:MAG TPA: hypothetical protein VK992_01015, partial [Candidatus Caenarcaniphilales bacterium]|nr:hypothetical protein [Candidatus Caenarcaniphilales bacterium]